MTWDKAVSIFRIESWNLSALILTLGVNTLLFMKAEPSLLRRRYLQVQLCLILWIISKILKTVAFTEQLRWFFIVIQYLGVSFLGCSFLVFSWLYSRGRDLEFRTRLVLYILSFCNFLIIATNSRHHLFYAVYNFDRDSFGPLFYMNISFQYGQMLWGIICIVIKVRKSGNLVNQERLIAGSALIPLGFNFLYITNLVYFEFDITPVAASISLFLFALAAFRYSFLGVLPLAWKTIREAVNEPVALYSKKKTSLSSWPAIPAELAAAGEVKPGQVIPAGRNFYKLSAREKRRRWTMEYWIDVSRVVMLEQERKNNIEELMKSRALIEAQNRKLLRIARDEAVRDTRQNLHDTLGHSLTQIILLLHAAKVLVETDETRGLAVLKQAVDAGQTALAMIKKESASRRLAAKPGLLSELLYELVEKFHDSPVDMDICITGRERAVSPGTAASFMNSCRESLTNSIRHGRAGAIHITCSFLKSEILMLIVDDGAGCATIVPGMGLEGILHRMERIGGTARFWSEPEGGFQTSLSVPLNRG